MAPYHVHIRGEGRRVTATLTRLREMDALPAGSIVRATSSPTPRYFLRWGSGWLACDELGDVAEHMDIWAQLDGWPIVLPSRDLRRPVTVHELPERTDV